MRRLIVAAAFVAALLVAAPALAVPGALDPTFSGDGKVITRVTDRSDFAIDVAVQEDGKILAAGLSGSGGTNQRFGVVRYLSGGALDTTFSGDGTLTTDFSNGSDAANEVAVQGDGKIIAAGLTNPGNGANFALARYHPNGSLDTSFSTDGLVTTSFTPRSDSIQGVLILDDGDIVAAGIAGYLTANAKFALARYNSNGRLDTSFGGDGKVMTDFTSTYDAAFGIALQADGKFVVAGSAGDPNGRFALARYEPDGGLDNTFGGDGRVMTDFTSKFDEALGIVIQGDGKIVLGGGAGFNGVNPKFAAARYNLDGSLDMTFHGDGKVTTDFTSQTDFGSDVRLQADGKIVLGGEAGADGTNGRFALVRYDPNGSLDPTFNSDGRVTTDFTAARDGAVGVEIQPDGNILAAGGAAFDRRDTNFALARYSVI